MSTTASLGVRGRGYDIGAIAELSKLQLKNPTGSSFHDSHKDSCYVYAGGFDYRLTEGDLIAIFSQWGEIVDINLIRDRDTGASKGFCFIAYEDQRSTNLAVDNANAMRLLGRTLKVDHVNEYTVMQEIDDAGAPKRPVAAAAAQHHVASSNPWENEQRDFAYSRGYRDKHASRRHV